jgi:hypothetical protein
MTAGLPGDADVALDGAAQRALAAYRGALTPANPAYRSLDWLPLVVVVHVVTRSASAAATRVIVSSESATGPDLRVFADEAARLDPMSRLPLFARLAAHASAFAAMPIVVATVLWSAGQRINAYPGTFGLVAGGAFLLCIVGRVGWDAFNACTGFLLPARALLEQTVDEPERDLFKTLHANRPRRLLAYSLPVAWALLWTLLLGLVAVGFIVGHWGGAGPRSTGDVIVG